MATQSFYRSNNITMCPDGKYRWVYELDLYTTTAIIKEVWRAIVISIAIVIALMLLFFAIEGDFMEGLQFIGELAGILFGIFLVLSIAGYLLFAFIIGGKYCALFEMDEDGINNKALEKHVKKAELIGLITALAGIASGRPGVVGTGILGATRTSMYTSFDDVKELELLPKQHLIRVNETLSRNQVYAEDEDFAFVAEYLKAHCKNAKVRE